MESNDMAVLDFEVPRSVHADFKGLIEHMGITEEEALELALDDWIARNADLYDYDRTDTHNEESN